MQKRGTKHSMRNITSVSESLIMMKSEDTTAVQTDTIGALYDTCEVLGHKGQVVVKFVYLVQGGSLEGVNADYRPPALQTEKLCSPQPGRGACPIPVHIPSPRYVVPSSVLPSLHPNTYSCTHRTQQTSKRSQNNRRRELFHLMKYFVCGGHLCPTFQSIINRNIEYPGNNKIGIRAGREVVSSRRADTVKWRARRHPIHPTVAATP
eukprot:6181012-Pleurochrysis_carterae.AAC.1